MTPVLCNWCNIRKHWSLFFFSSFSSRAEKGSILLPMAWYPPSRDFLQEWQRYWTGIVSTSLFYSLGVMAMVTLRNFWSFWHLANTASLKDLTSTVVVTSIKMMQAVLWEWTSSCRSWGRHQLIGPPSNWHQILLCILYVVLNQCYVIYHVHVAINSFMQWSYLYCLKSMFHQTYHIIHVSKQQLQ